MCNFRTPEQCPSVVSLLAESYNPHVRYGAAMALGIACAGTGLREAIALLEPMVKFDPVNFVRQGALVSAYFLKLQSNKIALKTMFTKKKKKIDFENNFFLFQIASAMILIQQTDQTSPKTSYFRSLYHEVITNKHEDVMAKFGAILAQGIIDAGGRNVTVSLQSRTGHTNLQAVVGMLIFTQYWYWFPLAHCLSLAFTPTCVIALNSDLKMPKIELKSSAKPSLYAYPAPMEEKKAEEREKVATAVLSIAARQKRRETVDKRDEEKMDIDEDVKEVIKDSKAGENTPKDAEKSEKDDKKKATKVKEEMVASSIATTSTTDESKSDKEKEKEKEKESTAAKERKEPEPNFEILQNPARVMRQQLKVISIVDGQSYIPLKDVSIGGIIVTHRTGKKEDNEDLVEPIAACGPKGDEAKEPEAPESFEYIED